MGQPPVPRRMWGEECIGCGSPLEQIAIVRCSEPNCALHELHTDPPGMEILRRVLRRMRWDSQDGYPDVGADGKYVGHAGFVTTGLPQVYPAELDALFDLAGIVPDPIVTKGHCKDCKFAVNGRERGYAEPCGACKRPQMSNFEPR